MQSYKLHLSSSLHYAIPIFSYPIFISHQWRLLYPLSLYAPEKNEKLGSELSTITLEEARILVNWLQDKLGVSAASLAPDAVVVAALGAATEVVVVEEHTEFDVVIDEVPSNARINAIKAVRALTNSTFKKAKELIEGLPNKFNARIFKEDVEEAKKYLETVGAKVFIV